MNKKYMLKAVLFFSYFLNVSIFSMISFDVTEAIEVAQGTSENGKFEQNFLIDLQKTLNTIRSYEHETIRFLNKNKFDVCKDRIILKVSDSSYTLQQLDNLLKFDEEFQKINGQYSGALYLSEDEIEIIFETQQFFVDVTKVVDIYSVFFSLFFHGVIVSLKNCSLEISDFKIINVDVTKRACNCEFKLDFDNRTCTFEYDSYTKTFTSPEWNVFDTIEFKPLPLKSSTAKNRRESMSCCLIS